MGRTTGSWLSGPRIEGGGDNEFAGQDLGLAESGPGSLAGGWQRVLGLLVDWLLAYGVTLVFIPLTDSRIGAAVLAVWFVVGVLAVSLFGFTPGQWILGERVARVDYGPDRMAAEIIGEVPPASVGVVRALGRQVLVACVVPALINDYNGRAMHDRATGTAIIRTR